MRIALRSSARAILALLLLCAGILLSLKIDDSRLSDHSSIQPASAVDAPRLTFKLSRGRLAVSGTTESAAHEADLARIAADRFRNHDIVTEFSAGVLLPEDWQPLSLRLLYAIATMESANVVLQDRLISIRGVTADPESLAQRLELLRDVMPAETTLLDNVLVVSNELTLDELCQRTFADLNALPIAFQQSSAALRTSAYSSLDKVVDFAWDCQHMAIVISGHTDASGDESWNRQLSLARARAVADYLENKGIDPERLIVEGHGSSMPVADNDTAFGRSLNRRIEFQVRRPLL